MEDITVTIASGNDLVARIDDLARLRIAVFREYPYLYDGTLAYERSYLATYSAAPTAMAVIAIDNRDGVVIGASTGVPMVYETEAFKQPFMQNSLDPATIFYCGESVLLPAYRGRGIYRHFMGGREQYAVGLGLHWCCFCAVIRPADHPLRPPDYRPLDDVWHHFGYQPQPSLITTYPWKDIDQDRETDHPMLFWCKRLRR